jgi:hypothetical protein
VIWIEVVGFAVLFAGVVRIALIIWPPRGAQLPDPSTVPGMPMAGPALQKAAHAAINRKKS